MSANDIQVSLHGNRVGLDAYGNLIVDGRVIGSQVQTRGNVWYLNSVIGDDTYTGKTANAGGPVATLNEAFDKVTANQGDIIVVLPGHQETIGNESFTADVAGVYILGVGNGDDQPQFKFNHASAEISVSANGIVFDNLRFSADVTSVAIGLEIEDGVDYTVVRNCLFDVVTAGTDEFTAAIHMVNDNTGTIIENNTFDMGIAAAVAAIHMDADTDKTVIKGNVIRGDYSTACIAGDTTLSTNILIQGNILVNGVGGDLGTEPCIELLTGTTGIIADNYCVCNLATKAAAIVADTCMLFENYYNEDAGSSGTGGIIGTASADD